LVACHDLNTSIVQFSWFSVNPVGCFELSI
jgi:hypothetical protein